MRDVVLHAGSGLRLDFAKDDFGGPEQAVIIQRWMDGERPSPGEFICYEHRDYEQPSLYLQRRDGDLLIAAHWPNSGLAGTHQIYHYGVSDEHKRQVEYARQAGEAAGFRAEVEVPLRAEGSSRVLVRPDAIIYGSQVNMGVEVQRSALSPQAAKARTTKAWRLGVKSVWFSDNRSKPAWGWKVPGVRMMDMPWDTLPRRRSVTVVSGVRVVKAIRCRDMRNGQCPNHRYGCSAWHPDHEPRPETLVDDLAELMPAGALVPMLYRTLSGNEFVFIVQEDHKALYEELAGKSADLPLGVREREPLRQEGRIVCNTNAGDRLLPPSVEHSVPNPSEELIETRIQQVIARRPVPPLPTTETAKPVATYNETLERLIRASRAYRHASGASLRRHWEQEIARYEAALKMLKGWRAYGP